MSEFDEEAERERLREKYERDKQKREASERMSELLLKGATMTNAHCDTCGDPIFRYDGQEFCPTCQVPTGGSQTATEAGGQGGEGAVEESADAAAQSGTPEDGVQAESGERVEVPSPDPAPDDATDPKPREPASANVDRSTRSRRSPPSRTGSREDEEGDLDAARAALERTLADAARRAEGAEDARSRREHLDAATEAAEALAALRNAR